MAVLIGLPSTIRVSGKPVGFRPRLSMEGLLSTVDIREMFRELTDALDGGVRGFSLVSRWMENSKRGDQRCCFVLAADGLPGKTAEVRVNVTKLMADPALRYESHGRLVSILSLTIWEALEAGGHRHLAESEEDVLLVNFGDED